MKFLHKIYLIIPNWMKNLILSFTLLKQRKIRYGNFYKEFYKSYQDLFYKNEETVYNYQLKEVKKLLLECFHFSKYYGDIFREKEISEKEINEMKRYEQILDKLPYLEKNNLKLCNTIIQNSSRKKDYKNFTSGTSGTPNLIFYDKKSLQIGFALWKRFHDSIGLPPKFSSVRLSGKIMVSPERKTKPFWVHNIFDNQLFMSTYHLKDENMEEFINKLNKFKPEFIDSYPSAIFILSKYINTNKIKLKFKPIAIATTAETLYDHYKSEIEKAFCCKVYNQYSSSEGGPFITECSEGKLHLNTDSGIFEFLNSSGNPARAGEIAELCVTSLRQWKTPLIKYKTGDWVRIVEESFTYQKCKCGCLMPIVKEIIGRQEDILFTEEKGYVGRLDPAYKGLNGIIKSKIIQHSMNQIEILNETDKEYNSHYEQKLIENIRDRVGKNIVITVKCVKEIPLGAAGKFKAVERKFPLPITEK